MHAVFQQCLLSRLHLDCDLYVQQNLCHVTLHHIIPNVCKLWAVLKQIHVLNMLFSVPSTTFFEDFSIATRGLNASHAGIHHDASLL